MAYATGRRALTGAIWREHEPVHTPTRPIARLLRTIAIVFGLVLVTASCQQSDDEAVGTATPTPATPVTPDAGITAAPVTPDAAPPTSLPEPVEERVVNVYWLRGEQLAVGGRVLATEGVAMAAMNALGAGPNDLETDLGMFSLMPAGTEVLGLTITDGVATVDLSSEFNEVATGTAGETYLLAQVVYTLTQFPGVESVTIIIEGAEMESILAHGWDP